MALRDNQQWQTDTHFNPSEGPEPPAVIAELAGRAGVQINGNRPWDMQVHSSNLYSRILLHGSLGLGEGYMAGEWDCRALDELCCRFLRADLDQQLSGWARVRLIGEALRQRMFNLQSEARAFQVGEQHYDIGNEVFEAMLDSSMSYSCGFWAQADDLEQAQWDKLDLICRKLELKPGDTLLEIGCGWGGLARHAAEYYGAEVTGITVSREQQALARERCEGLPVNIELMDYRKVEGQFDKLVSVGMFEHVGPKNYDTYFDAAERLMKPDGLFLLHTIGAFQTAAYTDPWIDKYIFPNGKLPSAEELASALNGRFLIEDWHNFGQDYDPTLRAWWERFNRAWPELKHHYSDRFYRMWRFYLLGCAGFFRARQGQLWQVVLSKRSREAGYRSVR